MPSKKNGFSRKDEILRQATIMFRERGYAGSSVRDLAMLAGIEAPSIYSHFKSKEDILQNICGKMARTFTRGLTKAEKESKPEQRFRTAVALHVQTTLKYADAAAVMWNEWKHLGDDAMEDFKARRRNYEQRIQQILIEGMDAGIFVKQDPIVLSNFIFSALNGIIFWYHGEVTRDELTDTINKLVFDGIKK